MTVIAAGVVNRQSRIILSRQFTEISRVHIEALLSAFPRLLEGYNGNRQVNYIDADELRYVYQPLEELILVLITPISSNIVEDLATLHLMGGLIPEYVRDGLSESSIEKAAFLIFMAFDEVIIGGKREDTTLDQIKVYLAMDSYEERQMREMKEQQVEQARRVTAEKARELREKRRTGMMQNTIIQTANNRVMMTTTSSSSAMALGGGGGGAGFGGMDSYVGIGPVDESSVDNSRNNNNNTFEQQHQQQQQQMFGDFSNVNNNNVNNVNPMPASSTSTYGFDMANQNYNFSSSNVKTAAAPRSAMTLGKAKKGDVMSKVQKEMGFTGAAAPLPTPSTTSKDLPVSFTANNNTINQAQAVNSAALAHDTNQTLQSNSPVVISVQEKMTATLSRGDEPVPVEVKGEMSVLIHDPHATNVQLVLDELNTRLFTYRCHARVNKTLFNSHHIISSVDNKPLPIQQSVTLLRWRLSQPGSVPCPITFECWPENGSITIEYKFVDGSVPSLDQVHIAIPLYGVIPDSYNASVGTCEFVQNHLVWFIPHIDNSHNDNDENNDLTSGNIEIILPHNGQQAPDEVFFPIDISFISNVSIGKVNVNEVKLVANDTHDATGNVNSSNNNAVSIPFAQTSHLITENLRIA